MFLPFALFVLAQSSAPVADTTLPPQGAVPVVTAEARGVQIYHCAAQGQTFQWSFDAPQAMLYKPGTDTLLGTHTIGPTWTWTDGSSVTGVVSATNAAPQTGNIPWLLLKTLPVSTATGTLARVAWVRRSGTQGGTAPAAGCDKEHEGTVQQVPYTATYTFYAQPAHASIP